MLDLDTVNFHTFVLLRGLGVYWHQLQMQKKPVTRNADNIIEKQDTNGVDPWNHLDVIVAHNHLKSFGRL